MFRVRTIIMAVLSCAAGAALAQQQDSSQQDSFQSGASEATYEVTITNITHGEAFTPVLIAVHNDNYRLFNLGAPIGAELAVLAQEGFVAPLQTVLNANRNVGATVAATGATVPGATLKLTISAKTGFNRLSLASMLIPTNDAFVALNGFDLGTVARGKSVRVQPIAYDAGAEINNEKCEALPSTPFFPECGANGGGVVAGKGEGFVHVHNGIHGIGDMVPWVRTWQNPVASVEIKRVR